MKLAGWAQRQAVRRTPPPAQEGGGQPAGATPDLCGGGLLRPPISTGGNPGRGDRLSRGRGDG